MSDATLAPLLESFFIKRLTQQQGASPNTIAAYRDAFRLLLRYVQDTYGKAPATLKLTDLDAGVITAFLQHLETDRGNSIRTRNVRLAAIHAFYHYSAFEEPAHAAVIQRVLAIPQKRAEKKLVEFLHRDEVEAMLAAPNPDTRLGRRDHAILLVAAQTGLRVSELIGLSWADLQLDGAGAHVRCVGKGRKERSTPLTKQASTVLRNWKREIGAGDGAPVFPSNRGGHLSRDAVERLVRKHAETAAATCASLVGKRVTPHMLRHTTAVDLLQSGVDCTVIALWLGHESIRTTHIYLAADLALKEKALARTAPHETSPGRYRPADHLMAFLQGL
ncbi:MAG: integrase/recombinase XerD [Myxococcota bacterium]|jgi:integrase/recombinase XerD